MEVIFKQPEKPFSEFSNSYKNKAIQKLCKAVDIITYSNPSSFFTHLLNNGYGKDEILPIVYQQTIDPVLENISRLYRSSPLTHKVSVLSLVANNFPFEKLESLFGITQSQYTTAKKKNISHQATLQPRKKTKEKKGNEISNETISLLVQFCVLNSDEISDPRIRLTPWLDFEIPEYSQEITYNLKEPKKKIYTLLKQHQRELKLSLSSFYKYIPKNFIKSKKRTDLCPLCSYSRSNISSCSHNNTIINDSTLPTSDSSPIIIGKFFQHLNFY